MFDLLKVLKNEPYDEALNDEKDRRAQRCHKCPSEIYLKEWKPRYKDLNNRELEAFILLTTMDREDLDVLDLVDRGNIKNWQQFLYDLRALEFQNAVKIKYKRGHKNRHGIHDIESCKQTISENHVITPRDLYVRDLFYKPGGFPVPWETKLLYISLLTSGTKNVFVNRNYLVEAGIHEYRNKTEKRLEALASFGLITWNNTPKDRYNHDCEVICQLHLPENI